MLKNNKLESTLILYFNLSLYEEDLSGLISLKNFKSVFLNEFYYFCLLKKIKSKSSDIKSP